MAQNPDLIQTGQDIQQLAVPPLVTMTAPMSNTKIPEHIYYVCTIPNASMFRQDGKKLPFVGGYLKTNVKEDIAYLDGEIDIGSIYIKRASPKEIEAARMFEDPLGVIKDAVRHDIEKQVRESYTIEQLEALLKEKKMPKVMTPVEAPESKARRLLAEMQSKKLTPASTRDVASGIVNSDSSS